MKPTIPIDPTHSRSGAWKSHVAALLLVVLATLAGLGIAQLWGRDPVVLVYILPVLFIAIYGGLNPSLTATVVSTLAYNYYFTEPLHTFAIHSASDVVTVIVLFMVAITTSRLASQAREQARLAAEHATRNASIAGFARKLLVCPDEAGIYQVTVKELALLFSCNVVMVTGPDPSRVVASSPGQAELAPSELAAAALTITTGEPAGRGVQRINLVDWHFRPVSTHAVLAAVGLSRDDGQQAVSSGQLLLLGNLLDQTALALERVKLEMAARDVVRLRERDKIRSSLLSSIGEDVKPRLLEINWIARELKRSGSGEKALVSQLSLEIGKLGTYIDTLGELESGEIQQPIEVGALRIDLKDRLVYRNGEEVHLTPKEYALLAELAKHSGRVLSHSYLLRAVWGPAHTQQIDYLRVAIRALRMKLEDDPAFPALILNEPGVGYRITT